MLEPLPQVQLRRVVDVIGDVLGTDLLGAYLFGSAVLGGLRHGSDLDVLAVATRRTTPSERRNLVAGLLLVSGESSRPEVGRAVEVTIVVQREVRPFRLPTRLDFQYGNWLRDAFAAGDDAPWEAENPDVAVLITMALLADRPLIGPPPSDVLDAVPHDLLVAAMVQDLDRLAADLATDSGNVLLTLARIWSTVDTGRIRSKDEAADWVLARLPGEHRPVLARARAIYLGHEPERWDDLADRLEPHADHVIASIRPAAAPRPDARRRRDGP